MDAPTDVQADENGTRFRGVRAICAAVPALVAVVFSAVIVVTAVAGNVPTFWRGGTLTLSEAAALHDHGAIVRLIASGSDPNGVYPLRPDVLAVGSLTPLEAAVGARRAEVIDILMAHGVTIDAATWQRLHCFAVATGAADVVQTIDRYRPAGLLDGIAADRPAGAVECAGVAVPF